MICLNKSTSICKKKVKTMFLLTVYCFWATKMTEVTIPKILSVVYTRLRYLKMFYRFLNITRES